MYNIEKVSQSSAKPLKHAKVTYPFADMVEGDSFFVPDSDPRINSVGSAARAYGRRHNVVFKTKKAQKDGVNGLLIYIDESLGF